MSVTQPLESPPAEALPTRNASRTWIVTLGIVVLLAHLPLLVIYFRQMWLKPHYEFFPLVFLGSLLLAWPAWNVLRSHQPTPADRAWSVIPLAFSLLLLGVGVVIESPILGFLAGFVFVIAGAIALGGWPLLRALIPALVYLALIIRPPLNADYLLVSRLQSLTSRCSSRVLDFVGVYHSLNGNTVEIAGKSYFVDDACSGINSLFSTLAVTLFFVFWVHRHWLHAILLLLAAVFWVLVQNILRVALIVYLDSRHGWDLSVGWKHQALGFAMFALTLAILWSSDRFLLFLGNGLNLNAPRAREALARPTLRQLGDRLAALVPNGWMRGLTALYAGIVLVQFADIAIQVRDLGGEASRRGFYDGFTLETLPESVGPWTRLPELKLEDRDRTSILGSHSRIWTYRHPSGLTALVSLDYPFPDWHDLRYCYKFNGWSIGPSTDFTHAVPDGSVLECLSVEMSRPVERKGYLWFSEFTEAGMPLAARESLLNFERQKQLSDRLNSLRENWVSLLTGRPARPRSYDILQVQLLCETHGPMPAAVRDPLQTLFTQCLERLHGRCRPTAGPSGS